MKLTHYQFDAITDIATDTYETVEVKPDHQFIITTDTWKVHFFLTPSGILGYAASEIDAEVVLEDLIEGAKESGEWTHE